MHAHKDLTMVSWVVDNGASMPCFAVASDFADLKLLELVIVSGIDCHVKGVGDMTVEVSNKQGSEMHQNHPQGRIVRPRSRGMI